MAVNEPTVLDVPRRLPSIPCPVYDGRPVTWGAWERSPVMHCIDQSCACGYREPGAFSVGFIEPLPGETYQSTMPMESREKGARRRWVKVERRAHRYMGLMAYVCPQCLQVTVTAQSGNLAEPEVILCDGCDETCAVGATLDEARGTLARLGGWSVPDADRDLCARCNPGRNPDPGPQTIETLRVARMRAPAEQAHPLVLQARRTVDAMPTDAREHLARFAEEHPEAMSPELARLLGLSE